MNSFKITQTDGRNLVALFVVVLLASCSGGGGGGGSTTAAAPISATATTTAQKLTVGTAMANFSPLTASGGAAPYAYNYTGTLPAGLSFDAGTGVVTGTPVATYATSNVVFSVKDANNVVASTTSTVSFTVDAAIRATATTTTQSLTVGTAMTAFSPLTPSGGVTPYAYSHTGTLPTGLSFSTSTGVVSGTPAATYAPATVVFSVMDANGAVASTTSTVIFMVGPASPTISATAATTAQSLTVGIPMASFSPLRASGGASPYTFSYTGTLPAGLSFDTGTGAVTGTPTSPYPAANLIFSVKDANNVTASTTSTVSFTVVAFVTRQPNDTGITASQCLQAGSDTLVDCSSTGAIALDNAQDGMVGRDANPATNSSTDGMLGFSFTAVAGGCVQDNVTGLMWEVKTTDGGLRDWSKTYTNYGDSRAGDASAYAAAVNATNLCGYSDWRLPTADELQSIVDYGVAYPGPSIDATWFPNTQATVYWSASPALADTSAAWAVYFDAGEVIYDLRISSDYVRLVRTGQ